MTTEADRAEYFTLASDETVTPGRYTHLTAALEHPDTACVVAQCEPCEVCTVYGRVWPDDPDSDEPSPGWCHIASHVHSDRWRCTVRWETHTVAWCRFLKALRDEQEAAS